MEFKDRLRELRISRNMSQMQLAKELHLSQSAVAKWELGIGRGTINHRKASIRKRYHSLF